MKTDIANRIAGQLGVDNLTDLLADNLSGADLHSLLLSVIKKRIIDIEPSSLAVPGAVTKTCDLDARLLNKVESIAYETASNFEAVELSPLQPLGAVHRLTGLDQANVLSTIRAFECVSDPTVGMAIEAARRRKIANNRKNDTLLCTTQRVVRFPIPQQNPAYTAHFKLFSLVSAGRDTGSFAYEIEALRDHIDCYLCMLNSLEKIDFAFQDIVVELSDTRVVSSLCTTLNIDRDQVRTLVRARDSASSKKVLDQYSATWPETTTGLFEEFSQFNLPKHLMHQLILLQQNVLKPLQETHANVRFEFNLHRLTGLGYYDGPCFHIKLKNDRDVPFMLADGGFVNWTQVLLSDCKERLMTSAIGEELICRMFRQSPETTLI